MAVLDPYNPDEAPTIHPLSGSEFVCLFTETWNGWMADRAPRLGASLAFYTLLSMAPMIIVVVAIASLAFGEEAARGRLVWQIQDLVGRQGALVIQGLLKSTRTQPGGWIPTIIGVIALFFGASAAATELCDALNTIWHVPVKSSASNWLNLLDMLKNRAFSFAMVMAVGFLLLLSLVVNAWVLAMRALVGQRWPMPDWLMQTSYAVGSFLIITFLFAMLYKFVPDVRLEWMDVLVGAAATSILFTLGKVAIGFYLGKSGFASTYGAAGSLAALLLWIYYSAQVFFFGAEFTCVYTHRHGSIFRQRLELYQPKPERHVVLPGETGADREVDLFVPEVFEHKKGSA